MRTLLAALLLVPSLAVAKPLPSVFYVYSDKAVPGNHGIPSGWMGDYGDLKIDDGYRVSPQSGNTSIKWSYSGKGAQGANWAGAFWQHPANNWGEIKDGGFNLDGYKRLTFWARGETGGEMIKEFKVGGIGGSFPDTDSANLQDVVLTKDWKQYVIDLKGLNLASISGVFCWVTNRDANTTDKNPDGAMTFFLDEIKFEK